MRLRLLFYPILLLLIPAKALLAQALGDVSDLPFTLELEEVTSVDLPGLHSGAVAKWEGQWVYLGGRINGLHGFFILTGFPEDKANVLIHVIDPETGDQLTYAVDDLDIPYPAVLKATNPQYTQDGDILYITGGYGKNPVNDLFETFPVMTAVNIPLLIEKMIQGSNPSAAFQQLMDDRVQVCGGEMEKLGDYFYLVGGHDFSGLYNQSGPPQFVQTYTEEIRRFKVDHIGDVLSISDYSAYEDTEDLHRRDFSLAPLLLPNGQAALGLYGGVFQVEEDLPFYNPVYISEDNIFSLDTTYAQLFSQYTCPVIPIFDTQDSAMYSIFFAGLSVYTWDEFTEQLEYDARVPFINDITVLHRKADGSSTEYLLPQRFDELLGSNMIYVPAEEAPHYPNDVLDLREMMGPTFVGYLYGGIKAELPNITPSSANKRLFKVYLHPKVTTATNSQASIDIPVQLSPNPFTAGKRLHVSTLFAVDQVDLLDRNGAQLSRFSKPETDAWETISSFLSALPSGMYYLQISNENYKETVKLVKL